MEELDKAYIKIIERIIPILNDMTDDELKQWWWSSESTNKDRWEALEHFANIGQHKLRERCRGFGFVK